MRAPSRLSVYTTADGTQITVRSALEARWAIFFSELHLDWHYEPGTLGWYNPDFGIKGLGFIEIKPTLELLISETASKIEKTTKAFSFPGEKIYADHFVSVEKVIDLNRIAHEETARFKEQFK